MTPRLVEHGGGLGTLRFTTNICVTVDGKVIVGRRLHHRAGVHRRRPHGQSSPLWPQWAAACAWPLVVVPHCFAHPRAADARVRPIFFTHVMQMYHILSHHTQPAFDVSVLSGVRSHYAHITRFTILRLLSINDQVVSCGGLHAPMLVPWCAHIWERLEQSMVMPTAQFWSIL